jgi:hypothetical protein
MGSQKKQGKIEFFKISLNFDSQAGPYPGELQGGESFCQNTGRFQNPGGFFHWRFAPQRRYK